MTVTCNGPLRYSQLEGTCHPKLRLSFAETEAYMKPSHQKRIRALGATLPAIVLILIAAPSIRSHGQDPQKQIPEPEVQQLKDRLKQLEQTVEELKAQLNSVEDSKKQPTEVATASPGPDGNAGPAQQSEGDAK